MTLVAPQNNEAHHDRLQRALAALRMLWWMVLYLLLLAGPIAGNKVYRGLGMR